MPQVRSVFVFDRRRAPQGSQLIRPRSPKRPRDGHGHDLQSRRGWRHALRQAAPAFHRSRRCQGEGNLMHFLPGPGGLGLFLTTALGRGCQLGASCVCGHVAAHGWPLARGDDNLPPAPPRVSPSATGTAVVPSSFLRFVRRSIFTTTVCWRYLVSSSLKHPIGDGGRFLGGGGARAAGVRAASNHDADPRRRRTESPSTT